MVQPAFDSAYARLPDRFFARVAPTPVAAPRLIRVNAPLAAELGIDPDWLASEEGVAAVAGNRVVARAWEHRWRSCCRRGAGVGAVRPASAERYRKNWSTPFSFDALDRLAERMEKARE